MRILDRMKSTASMYYWSSELVNGHVNLVAGNCLAVKVMHFESELRICNGQVIPFEKVRLVFSGGKPLELESVLDSPPIRTTSMQVKYGRQKWAKIEMPDIQILFGDSTEMVWVQLLHYE